MEQPSIHDIFKTQGTPTITYVAREAGIYEAKVADSIRNKGTICLLTGPSKTGKTTLYNRVGQMLNIEPLSVRCHKDLSAKDVWQKALEHVNFERLTSRNRKKDFGAEVTGEISGSIGWKWLAGLSAKSGTKISRTRGEAETRERILADANPLHLIPILKTLPTFFVLEDFHYLLPEVQAIVFQQCKEFVDSEVSFVTVSTTHHAVDLVYGNKDLLGRLEHIDVPTWKVEDLQKIARQGFRYLNLSVDSQIVQLIAGESVGLPIITQAVCKRLLAQKNITHASERPEDRVTQAIRSTGSILGLSTEVFVSDEEAKNRTRFELVDALEALHAVAKERYPMYEDIYERLSRGLRKHRKYQTYELILSCFTLGELAFSVSRTEIADRMKNLQIDNKSAPPPAVIARTLSSLSRLQEKIGIELLEWHQRYDRLHIIDPTFLFYLRWRRHRDQPPSLQVVWKELSGVLNQIKAEANSG